MMSGNFERRSLQLTKEEWAELERLAGIYGTTAAAGSSFGEPSWRRLIKLIAVGEIQLFRKQSANGEWLKSWSQI